MQIVWDRASYAGALVSIASSVQPNGGGRMAIGDVAHMPGRVQAAEAEMPPGAAAVIADLLGGASTSEQNAFKLPLVERMPRCWPGAKTTKP